MPPGILSKFGQNLRQWPLWLALVAAFWGKGLQAQLPTSLMDPLIGTQARPGLKGIFVYGRTTPFVTPPFGMTHWTPLTHYPHIAWCGYHYNTHRIIGFRGSHKPAMWMGDYGYVTLMPGTGRVKVGSLARSKHFSHKREESHPYLYKVELGPKARPLRVEMTASAHVGIFQITFPRRKGWIYIEASKKKGFEGYVEIDPARNIVRGYNPDYEPAKIMAEMPDFKGYFEVKFDQSFDKYGTTKGKRKFRGNLWERGDRVGAWVKIKHTHKINLEVTTSFIGWGQMDFLHWHESQIGFETNVSHAISNWRTYAEKFEIKGASESEQRIFYTALYHCLLFPRTFGDNGKYYSPFDGKIHFGTSYTDFSLWDTFRAEHPLLTLVAPDRVDGMIRSLLQNYEEGGWLPKWPNPTYSNIMIGTHADAVIADAYVKGFRGFDENLAWEAMHKNAMTPPDGDSLKRWHDRAPWSGYEGRAGLTWYKKLGYVPADKTDESVSRTLEFAHGDYCLAAFAEKAGKTAEADFFLQRSKNYRHLYNPATGFMAPKNSDGTWHQDPAAGFTEGSPWTYLFCVMQDIPGLIELMGREKFVEMLDRNFSEGHYVHENEPGHHYCYLYNYLGMPWRTQELVARYRREKYRDAPDGLDGDDDCGQMSAWYVFSAMGFYPVTPGSGVYAIGTPLFPQLTLKTGANEFTIKANGVSEENIYVQSVKLNGLELQEPFLRHEDILKGGILEFEMGKEKSDWGSGK
ncbi:MAG: glycoside hydrolase family 92 protein [Bacteroidia bacterium]|nr:glycoside hydrolase family 92 protein [Bacteroidia bacterium]